MAFCYHLPLIMAYQIVDPSKLGFFKRTLFIRFSDFRCGLQCKEFPLKISGMVCTDCELFLEEVGLWNAATENAYVF